jgi:hypothetical protein
MIYVDGLNGEAPNPNPLPTTPTPGPNVLLANQFGITMGTAHNEPMARTLPEWNTVSHYRFGTEKGKSS